MSFAASGTTRLVAAVSAAALVITLTACGGDDGGTSPTESTSASASASPSVTAEPSETPSAAAATGPLLKIPGVQMTAPAGWELSDGIVEFEAQAAPPTGPGSVQLVAIAFPGTPPPLDKSAKLRQKTAGEGFKRLPDVEVAGETFYHLAGTSGSLVSDNLGTVANGYDVTILVDLSSEVPPEERDRIIAESLATFAWER